MATLVLTRSTHSGSLTLPDLKDNFILCVVHEFKAMGITCKNLLFKESTKSYCKSLLIHVFDPNRRHPEKKFVIEKAPTFTAKTLSGKGSSADKWKKNIINDHNLYKIKYKKLELPLKKISCEIRVRTFEKL